MLNSQEQYMAMVVAHAAPATSMPSPATNTRSSTIFTAQETIRNSRDALLSPIPRRIPAFMLYPIFPRVPKKIMLI